MFEFEAGSACCWLLHITAAIIRSILLGHFIHWPLDTLRFLKVEPEQWNLSFSGKWFYCPRVSEESPEQ